MDGFFNNLYKKFFIRDVLSIFISGFIVLISLVHLFGGNAKMVLLNESSDELTIFSIIVIIGISYLIGLLINAFRDLISFRCIYGLGKNYFLEYLEIKEKYYENTEKKEWIKDERERIVAMVHISGNIGVSVLIASVILCFSELETYKILIFLIIFGVLSLFFSYLKFLNLKAMMGKYGK